MRSCNLTLALMSQWLGLQRAKVQEQHALNIITRGGAAGHLDYRWPMCLKDYKDKEDRLLMCMNRSLPMGLLPVHSFMHSYSYYVTRLHEVGGARGRRGGATRGPR
jgi:hypothetical protein